MVFTKVIEEDVRRIVEDVGPALKPLEGTTLVVTGGNGFLLSYLLDSAAYANDHLLHKPVKVVCLDNSVTGRAARTEHLARRPEFRFVSHDVSKPLDLEGPADWIVHGASIASPTFYRQKPLETIDVNVNGTWRMLDLAVAKKAKGFVFLSTSEIYGDPPADKIPTHEDYRGNVSATGPRACYDESKRLGETLTQTYTTHKGVTTKTIRPFNVYGPGQPLGDKRIIPDLMAAGLAGGPIVLHGDGRATRSFCYVSDAIRAMWHILLHGPPGSIYNVGNDEVEISMGDLSRRFARIAGLPESAVHHKPSADQHYLTDNPQRRAPDLTRLRKAFPWTPQVGLEEGLRRTLEHYRALPEARR